jgi:hypothetical protein
MIFRKYLSRSLLLLPILLFSCIAKKNSNVIIINIEENISIIENQENRNNFVEDYYARTIIYNTNIKCVQNDSEKILLKTRAGCSKTGFKIKKDYFEDLDNLKKIFIVSTIDDLRQLQDKYIELPFLDEFSINYFDENYLTLILANYSASAELRNEHINENDDKYSFVIEYWYRGSSGDAQFPYCSYTALYILKLPKK